MKKKIIVFIALIILLLSLSLLTHKYKTFTRNEYWGIASCKSCVCIGNLIMLESYLEQYHCSGLNFCKNIDINKCSKISYQIPWESCFYAAGLGFCWTTTSSSTISKSIPLINFKIKLKIGVKINPPTSPIIP